MFYKRSKKRFFHVPSQVSTKVHLLAQVRKHPCGNLHGYLCEKSHRAMTKSLPICGNKFVLLLDNTRRMTVFRQIGKYLTSWISHDSRPGKPFAPSQSVCLDVSSNAWNMMSLTENCSKLMYTKILRIRYMTMLALSPLRGYKIKFQGQYFELLQ